MSKLANSCCCDNTVRLADLAGKKIEFRQYGDFAPQIGTKWICPTCETEYFVYFQRKDQYWKSVDDAPKKFLHDSKGVPYENEHQNKFVTKKKNGDLQDTGCYVLVLTYYHPLTKDCSWRTCSEEKNTQLVRFFPIWMPLL